MSDADRDATGDDEVDRVETTPESDDAAGELTAESVAERLGPFEPPADFDHGAEFTAEPPRPIPDTLSTGSYIARRRATVRALFVAAMVCCGLWLIPPVRGLSVYLHPLAYLHWAGLGLLAIAFFKWRNTRPVGGPFHRVRDESPAVGRVVDAGLAKIPQGEAVITRAFATVEFDDPATGERQFVTTLSDEQLDAVVKAERHTVDLEPGQYVTLVGDVSEPGRFAETLRVYGFLGLDPEREYILRDGEPWRGASLRSLAAVGLTVAAVIGLLLGLFVLVLFYFPTGGDWTGVLVPTAVCVVIGLFCGPLLRQKGVDGEPTGSSFGTGLLGGFLGLLAGFVLSAMANAWLDRSEPTYEPFRVVNLWQNTTNFVFSHYELEYRPVGSRDTDKTSVRFGVLSSFNPDQYGLKETGRGALGLTYVRRMIPLLLIELPAEAAADLPEEMPPENVVSIGAGDEKRFFVPFCPIGEDLVELPAEVTRDAIERLAEGGPLSAVGLMDFSIGDETTATEGASEAGSAETEAGSTE